ncbi:MAG: M64 family metallopeptidase, partial [Bacteroidota bacterium]
STFDFAGIHRLVVATNNFAINNVLANNFPNYDQVFILVNSGFYGGSGGVNAVSTTHPSAGEIAIHEIGHSFANLADEYYAGDQFAGEWPNMTMETDPNQVKWRNWHGDQGIGIYQHCCSGNATSWYKPHQNCKMQFLGVPFCAVCKETFVETIHDLVSPIDSYTHSDLQLDNTGLDIEFQTNLIYPIPNTLAIRWILNGDPLANTGDALTLTADQLDNGINQLTFEVVDQTTLSRSDAHPGGRLFFVNWQIEKTATSIEALGEQRSVEFSVFPNPFVEQVLIDYRLDETAMVGYQLYDLRGQVLRQQTPQRQAAGAHQVQLDLSQYPAGNYLLRWIIDTFTIDRTLVKPIGN